MARGQHPARRYHDAQGAGYPVHRVSTFREWSNLHRVSFTEYTAVCGFAETRTGAGWSSPLKSTAAILRTARAAEMCRGCWA